MQELKRAIEHVGGAASLARSLGVSIPAVYAWSSGQRRISADYCPAIERLTGGAVRCEELRPDVDWAVLRSPAAPAPAAPAPAEAAA